MGEWVKIAKKNDLAPGSSKHIELEDKGICVALSNVDGKYYAIDSVCPHMGGPLGEGEMDGNMVVCPWHGWPFDVVTGNCAIRPGLKQKVFTLKIEGEEIFVEL